MIPGAPAAETAEKRHNSREPAPGKALRHDPGRLTDTAVEEDRRIRMRDQPFDSIEIQSIDQGRTGDLTAGAVALSEIDDGDEGIEDDIFWCDLSGLWLHDGEATPNRSFANEAIDELWDHVTCRSIDEHGCPDVVIGLAEIDDHHRVPAVDDVEWYECRRVDAQR